MLERLTGDQKAVVGSSSAWELRYFFKQKYSSKNIIINNIYVRASILLTLITTCTHYKTFTLSTLALSSENAKWKSFWDSFKSAIHENNRMSKIDIQFNYLNSLLEASASRSIQGPVSLPIPTTIQRLKFSRKIRQISTNNLDTY